MAKKKRKERIKFVKTFLFISSFFLPYILTLKELNFNKQYLFPFQFILLIFILIFESIIN